MRCSRRSGLAHRDTRPRAVSRCAKPGWIPPEWLTALTAASVSRITLPKVTDLRVEVWPLELEKGLTDVIVTDVAVYEAAGIGEKQDQRAATRPRGLGAAPRVGRRASLLGVVVAVLGAGIDDP